MESVVQSVGGANYLRHDDLLFRSFLSWRSILAGTLLSLLFYIILLALGVGLLGVSVDMPVGVQSMSIAGGIWIILANALALFGGAYIATRSTAFSSRTVGMWQSAVISALFFTIVIAQMSTMLGTAGRFFGNVAGVAANNVSGLSDIAANPTVQDMMDATFEGLQLRSSPDVVARGVVVRIVQGDGTAAENYLARQAGVSSDVIHSRMEGVRNRVDNAMAQARDTASNTMATAGFSLFVVMIVGLVSAIVGGYVGARENLRHPVTAEEDTLSGRTVSASL